MTTGFFEQLAGAITVMEKTGPLLIGVDGVDGAGKSHFAAELVKRLSTGPRPVFHSSIDYFHSPKAVRHRKDKEPHVSFFEDSFNYEALRARLLDPLVNSSGQSVFLRHFDHRSDSEVHAQPTKLTARSILVFDGIFLHRDELRRYWDYSIYLDVPFEETYSRMAKRDGCPPNHTDPRNSRYYRGQLLYIERCQPKSRATAVVNNSDFNNPRWASVV